MIFQILTNQMTTLFLSVHLLTTLSFDSEIQSYLYGGGQNEIFFQVTNKERTLALKPKTEGGFSNLLVITRNRKYYFQLDYDPKNPHTFIEVKDGVMNHALTKKTSSPEYDILEGDNSILFINKSPNEVTVNGMKVRSREYLSKGVPILLEGKRILN